jgi:tetratricopeptide (TPR) repeat protein
MRHPEAVVVLTVALLVAPRSALSVGTEGGKIAAPSLNSSTAADTTKRSPSPGAQRVLTKPSNARAVARPGQPPTFSSGVGTMRGISNPSRLAWRDARRHRHHTIFIFYDPFWPYFAYSPFYSYYASPIAYEPWPPGYTPAPVDEGVPSYGEDEASSASSKPDEMAAAKTVVETYPFARQAEEAFGARDYKGAVRNWRHAVVDEPNSGPLVLRLAQALFAAGEYGEAAGATEQALMLLSEEKWQSEVSNAAKLYGAPQDYKDQLKGLEKAVKENPDDPALRFELGFQYGFSGRRAEALRELDRLLQIAPQDQLGKRLRVLMAGKTAGETGAESKK